MKRFLALVLTALMVLSMTACSPGGSGNTSSSPVPDQSAAGTSDSKPETASSEELTFAIIAKSAGNPYNECVADGFKEVCDELGIKSIIQYPEDTSAEAQITVLNNLIAQDVNGIAVAANDPDALESIIKSARDKGIVVVTVDSDAKGSQLFINPAGVQEVARVFLDSVLDVSGGTGQFAVLSATSTATNQNSWIAAYKEFMENESQYAGLEWVVTVYGDDESQKSYDETESLLTNYPDLKVISCPTTVGILACAKAVQDNNSKVLVTGGGLPSELKNYVGQGKPVPYMYLWNPIDNGRCSAYAIKALIDGDTTGQVGQTYTAANGKTYEVLGPNESVGVYSTQVIVGPPFKFTEENIGEWADVY